MTMAGAEADKQDAAQPDGQDGQARHAPGMWGGRFERPPAELFRRFNDSLPFDYRLAREDVEGSIAWCGALERAGVLDWTEAQSLRAALAELDGLLEGDPRLPLASGEEDVHGFVERWLIERVGTLGKKLHTGRSRNDQVATDLRLWTRRHLDERLVEVAGLVSSLSRLARREHATIMPGYTHLQRAQPILLSHWALAHAESLLRDADRLLGARARVNLCPLGSAALAGTAYDIDREALARDLRFDAPLANSLDAVSARDFTLETLASLAILSTHLSRLAEELIIYSTGEFAFLTMGDEVTSGSSIMPQKKNPDAMELVRGKTGRVVGSLVGMLSVCKALPLAYNKDLQEDKEPLFDAMDHTSMCLRMSALVIETIVVDRERTLDAARGGYSNATELADYLAERGVPFRDAHEVVGRIVRHAIARGLRLEELPLEELQRFERRIDDGVFARLEPAAAIARRATLGGTSPARVGEHMGHVEQRARGLHANAAGRLAEARPH
ncbi:MAG: argininosuccinate lyase [Phycisphaerales bacterium]|jgi:argininosuccinate lyase|nr:argininosuccinate lyase [Phycisphaerales bacterium]